MISNMNIWVQDTELTSENMLVQGHMHACNPSDGETETGVSWGPASQTA